MEQNPSRQPRKVAIADHIWETFEDMAQQMGTDRDGLVNQAMFMFARLNGFLNGSNVAAAAAGNGARANGVAAAPAAASAAARPAPAAAAPSRSAPPVAAARAPARAEPPEDPARREVAERVLETAAELERLIKGKNAPEPEEEEEMMDEPPPDEDVEGVDNMDVAEEEAPPDEEAPAEEEGGALYLMTDGGDMDKIVKDRFVIGRGKHCDFVINSGKVSREHAVIVREGTDYFIEDLGSSNGTWFNKQRIKRRKVEDGDEYFICSEKIKLVTR